MNQGIMEFSFSWNHPGKGPWQCQRWSHARNSCCVLACGFLFMFCSFFQVKTFNEACLMVRKPALELLTYLKNSNFAHPAVRYVICIFYHLLDSRIQAKHKQVRLHTWWDHTYLITAEYRGLVFRGWFYHACCQQKILWGVLEACLWHK